MKCWSLLGYFLALGLVAFATSTPAAEPTPVKTATPNAAPPAEMVEMFAAAAKGDIEVRLIPKDSTTGTVTIKNKTKKPLTIKLPEAFVGVPVLAQLGGMGGGLGGGGGNNNQQNQAMGGGMMGGMGGGMMGGMGGGGFGGGGGGLFNVGPEKVGKLKVVAVCLEHGKDDPNPRIPYDLRPIESFTNKGEVIELVKMLAKGEIDQKSAQAAAWHLSSDLPWNELANKIGKKHLDGTLEPYFTAGQLEFGVRASREATFRAEEAAKKKPATQAVKSLSENK
ncbi:hypothetical protein ETAA8_51500 [Anatilimnocola aggregata]|uniref:Uncharacterized protein n=1 Tax=Anatilimnocola aggregata TaxID=2528021 RepID=A0A517YIJ8_9BACT|nr:hypothetical protein [Anatilimnocola aggregata]QDU30032.1 hypothetical protein ETAA8_51500 [Anatilimnocola aggregata]